ncbi:hypothetical protein RB200_04400 [Streptomyces sp. PmtG]
MPATAWLYGMGYWSGLAVGESYFFTHVALTAAAFLQPPSRRDRARRWLSGSLAWSSLPFWYVAVLAASRDGSGGAWSDAAPGAATAGGTLLLCGVALFLTSGRGGR